MFTLGTLGLVNPWLLAALIALPVLWWLLRAIPPSPKLQIFAGVRLLFGLEDSEREASKTPWWLLALRLLALAAVIIGFAGPVLNPSTRLGPAGEGPVLILMDQGWASAPDWPARKAAATAFMNKAGVPPKLKDAAQFTSQNMNLVGKGLGLAKNSLNILGGLAKIAGASANIGGSFLGTVIAGGISTVLGLVGFGIGLAQSKYQEKKLARIKKRTVAPTTPPTSPPTAPPVGTPPVGQSLLTMHAKAVIDCLNSPTPTEQDFAVQFLSEVLNITLDASDAAKNKAAVLNMVKTDTSALKQLLMSKMQKYD